MWNFNHSKTKTALGGRFVILGSGNSFIPARKPDRIRTLSRVTEIFLKNLD